MGKQSAVLRCEWCKKHFRTTNLTGRFCTREHWYKFYESQRSPQPCAWCKKLFKGYKGKKYCSYRCKYKGWARPRAKHRCLRCKKVFWRRASKGGKFCSVQCSLLLRNREGQRSLPVGTRRVYTGGYVYIKQASGRWRSEHRLILEKRLKRRIRKWERIHHRNGRRDDNRRGNLELWTMRHKDPPGVRTADAPHCRTCVCSKRFRA